MTILTLVIATAVDTLLIFLLSRWIGRIKLTLSNAFWGAAISQMVLMAVGFVLGFLLSEHLGTAFVMILLIRLAFQSVLLQIIARTQSEFLLTWRAVMTVIIVIAGGFLIASPIVELIQQSMNG